MKITRQEFTKAIKEEIIEMLSGDNNPMDNGPMTDQIFTLINQANLSDDAKEVMMKWMEHTDNPQAIIDYLEGTMNEATIEVKPEDLDKVKSKAKPEDTIRIVKEIDEDEIDKKATKAALSGKKDSIISLANQLVKVAMEMKSLAKEYKSAKEGKEVEKEKEILSKLKELTTQKKKLEAKLS